MSFVRCSLNAMQPHRLVFVVCSKYHGAIIGPAPRNDHERLVLKAKITTAQSEGLVFDSTYLAEFIDEP